MANSIGIVGAGLIGRMLALKMVRNGWRVHLFDRDERNGSQSCTYAGAGMLAPYCELDYAEPVVAALGVASLALWQKFLQSLPLPVFFQQTGSLVVAHARDRDELDRFERRVSSKLDRTEHLRVLDYSEIAVLEPELTNRFDRGLYFPDEAQVDNRGLLQSLAEALLQEGVIWKIGYDINRLQPHVVAHNGEKLTFDWVVDTRGLGAQVELSQLRGVRGELLIVRTPEVVLSRPIRMMHPRYPLYIVPRPDHQFMIGATSIESQDLSPISVRSTLELLSAAYALHPAFAEARVTESVVQCRPAFPDNLPKMYHTPGLMRINGLYRHGFLVSPALVDAAFEYLQSNRVLPIVKEIMYEET